MGWKGDLLRAEKAKRVTRTFTEEQLREHDRQVIDAYKKQADRRMQKVWSDFDKRQREQMDEHINELWKKRAAEFNSGLPEENMITMLSYLLSVSARVLIERFGWAPIEGHAWNERYKIVRFCNAVVEEIEKITTDERMGIDIYAQQTYEKYGVRFRMEDE